MGLAGGLAATIAGLVVATAVAAPAAVWQVVPSPSPRQQNQLLAVTAIPGGSGFWAVGYSQGPPDPLDVHTLIEHTTSSGWRVVASPNPGPSGSILSAVAAISPSDVWAVGDFNTPMHWNGRHWSLTPIPGAPAGGTCAAIAAVSADDVWAVGTHGRGGLPYSAHWNGRGWAIVAMARAGAGETVELTGLTRIAGSSRLFAVGSEISIQGGQLAQRQLIECWNGSHWRMVAAPPLVPGAVTDSLSGVASVSGSSVWAIGDWTDPSVTSHPLFEHWNGTGWRVVAAPGGRAAPGALTAVPGTTQLWATTLGTPEPVAFRYTGTTWVESPVAVPANSYGIGLFGIAAGRGTGIVAVGSWVGAGVAIHTLVERDP
jgi:hypothetical protein